MPPDNNVGDGVKHKANVSSVCGTCVVGVDLFLSLFFVEGLKSLSNVFHCFSGQVRAWEGGQYKGFTIGNR